MGWVESRRGGKRKIERQGTARERHNTDINCQPFPEWDW